MWGISQAQLKIANIWIGTVLKIEFINLICTWKYKWKCFWKECQTFLFCWESSSNYASILVYQFAMSEI